jgi:hypothetical protein
LAICGSFLSHSCGAFGFLCCNRCTLKKKICEIIQIHVTSQPRACLLTFSRSSSDAPDNPYHFASLHLTLGEESAVAADLEEEQTPDADLEEGREPAAAVAGVADKSSPAPAPVADTAGEVNIEYAALPAQAQELPSFAVAVAAAVLELDFAAAAAAAEEAGKPA